MNAQHPVKRSAVASYWAKVWRLAGLTCELAFDRSAGR